MGDQVALISYGVMLKESDYKKLYKELFELKNENDKYNSCWDEKDNESFLTIEQPYETEDYLLIVRSSKQSAFNGTKILKPLSIAATSWTEKIRIFLKERDINPESDCGWMLTAHYG